MVQELGHDVTGIARTHREAVESVRNRKPGLVLADILLADGSSGLDAVNEILASIDVPVVFITAFPERLLTGEKTGAHIPRHQAIPAGHRARHDQSGAVLRLSNRRRRGGRSRERATGVTSSVRFRCGEMSRVLCSRRVANLVKTRRPIAPIVAPL